MLLPTGSNRSKHSSDPIPSPSSRRRRRKHPDTAGTGTGSGRNTTGNGRRSVMTFCFKLYTVLVSSSHVRFVSAWSSQSAGAGTASATGNRKSALHLRRLQPCRFGAISTSTSQQLQQLQTRQAHVHVRDHASANASPILTPILLQGTTLRTKATAMHMTPLSVVPESLFHRVCRPNAVTITSFNTQARQRRHLTLSSLSTDGQDKPQKPATGSSIKKTYQKPTTKTNTASIQKKFKATKKFQIADEITEANMEKLAQAFDALARKEGFDDSLQRYADDATFEDDFPLDEDDFDDDESFDDDGSFDDESDETTNMPSEMTTTDAASDEMITGSTSTLDILDPTQFRLSDFMDEPLMPTNIKNKQRNGANVVVYDQDADDDEDMDARIASAQSDMVTGRISVPKPLDRLAAQAATADFNVLGFRTDAGSYYGDVDEPPKREFQLVKDAMVCSACGADFQSSNTNKPGYLPPEKFSVQVKLGQIEEFQRLQTKAENDEADWSAEDEIEWLIQTAASIKTPKSTSDTSMTNAATVKSSGAAAEIDIPTLAESMGLDMEELARKKTICKRCHGLQNFGRVENVLRPGWTQEPLLSQEKFRDLLRPIREKPAVIIALVDLFDFAGSVLSELDNIAGDNPVILAANKADLLPAKMGQVRVENWVRRELEYMGIQSLANMGGAVRLVSCKTGLGISAMLSKARSLADKMECDIYVVGAANAGKSTMLNQILGYDDAAATTGQPDTKLRAGNQNKRKGAVTTSPLPGTTLKFIKVDLGGGRSLYDTPGLLVPGTLTQLLTPEELKIVVPKNQVEPITFRVASGKAVLVGGLAKVELIGDCKPFLLTFFVANGIKLHPTDSLKADEFIQKHCGEILVPPLGGPERLAELGVFESHLIDVEGMGWKESAADISLTGLGWVSVTGAGTATVKVSVPKGVGVSLRPPLMPFDIWETTARYTGSKAVRKSTKKTFGKRHPGVGRN